MIKFYRDIIENSEIKLNVEKAQNYFKNDDIYIEKLIKNDLISQKLINEDDFTQYFNDFSYKMSFKQFESKFPSEKYKIITKNLQKESLIFFIKAIEESNLAHSLNEDGVYIPQWFHLIISNIYSHALRFKLGKSKSNPLLLLSTPPGLGKSMLSTYFIALLTAHLPEQKSIYCSYNEDLLKIQAQVFDSIVESSKFNSLFFNIFPIGKESSFKSNLSKSGTKIPAQNSLMKATFFGGAVVYKTLSRLTGIRATGSLIIDDPVSGSDMISSDKMMQALYDNVYSSILTRIEDDTILGCIATRWSSKDVHGILTVANRELSQESGVENLLNIKDVNIQGISTEAYLDKPYEFRTKSNEFFWAAHVKKIMLAKTSKNESLFQALYQGLTLEESGNVFKSEYFEYSSVKQSVIKEMLEKKHEIVISVDATFNDNKKSDKVAISVLAMLPDVKNAILIELINKRMSFLETVETLKELIKKYPIYSSVLIEEKANGSAIIETLQQNYNGIVSIKPTESKVARARASTPVFSQNMFLCDDKYFHDVKKQFIEFTGSDNGEDDIVDSICQALNYYKGMFFDNFDRIIPFKMKDSISEVKSHDLFSRYGLDWLR